MAQQTVNSSDTIDQFRTKSNSNFSELYARSVNVADYGAVGDGTTDDGAAIRSAISAAESSGKRYIDFPYGTNGIYLTATSLINSRMPARGLVFRAIGKQSDLTSFSGVTIKYTGSGKCFDFVAPAGATSYGPFTFDGLTFQVTNDAGVMFQFNDVTQEATDDGGAAFGYIRQITFKSCRFEGPGTDTTTSRAIQGVKLFELVTDDNCEFRWFQRAIYLKGTDNATIKGRFQSNVRHVMLTRSNSFGQSTKIAARFFGSVLQTNTTEDCQHLHLAADDTSIHDAWLEGGADAMVYLDGYNNVFYAPRWGTNDSAPHNVALRLGPNALDCVMFKPQAPGGAATTVIDAPTNWSSGGTNRLNQLIVHDPSSVFETDYLVQHPRIKVVSQYNDEERLKAASGIGASGTKITRRLFTPYDLPRATKYGAFSFITDVVTDTSGYKGYAMSFAASTGAGAATRSIDFPLTVGRDVQNGDTIRLTYRYRNSTASADGTLRYLIGKNGTSQSQGATTLSTSYTIAVVTYTLSGYTTGDLLDISAYNDASNMTAYLSSILFEVVPGAVFGSAQTLTGNSQTITLPTQGETVKPVVAGAARTGTILEAGTYNGQELTILMRDAFSVTFAAAGSNVAGGTAASIPASEAARFLWDANYGGAGVGRWVSVGA